MATYGGQSRRVRPRETYRTIAQSVLEEDVPWLAIDDAYVQRFHRRLVQLNQHRDPGADVNVLQLDEVSLPDLSTMLTAPHGDRDGQVRSGLDARELRSRDGLAVSFTGAIFRDDVVVDAVDIPQDVCFCGATFQRSVTITRLGTEGFACFENAVFEGQVTLRDVAVGGDLSFDGATFRRDVVLDRVHVFGSLSLSGARMDGEAWVSAEVDQATYFGSVSGAPGGFYLRRSGANQGTYCVDAEFAGDLHVLDHHSFADLAITRTTVAGELAMQRCRVDGLFSGRRLDVTGDCTIDVLLADRADLSRLRVRAAAFLGVRAAGGVDLRFLRVEGAADLQIDSGSLDGSGMLLAEGGSVIVSGGSALFERAAFPAGTIIRGTGEGPRPKLRSLIDSQVTELTLARLDARECSFEGTHDLDRLRVEDDVVWREVPRSGRYRWATRRQVLQEEALLRVGRGDRHWSDGADVDPGTRAEIRSAARRIADQYRALRKGFEDRRNEPGAADFYYGEMEMRRLGAAGWAERSLLTAYWLLSGYSLRAWRALSALAALTVVSTVVMAVGGFAPTPSPSPQLVAVGPEGAVRSLYVDPSSGTVTAAAPTETLGGFGDRLLPALTYSAESATVVFRGPETHTPTLLGRWCQILLRLLGPALLALAVFSLRARVKR